MLLSLEVMSNYFRIHENIIFAIESNGKDFTHSQFADIFEISRKTFENFYNKKTIDFELLHEVARMYGIEI